MPEAGDEDTSVRVAVRVRPQLAREKIDMCRTCTSVSGESNQVTLGSDRMFTYDFVFDMDSQQDVIYDTIVRSLIEGCFEGYNATVFAYGQTGSGKTYTMGTGFEPGISPEEEGIIPRAVHHLFEGIKQRKELAEENKEPPPEFKIHAQFMELYNEEILDLFDATRDIEASRSKKSHIKIHEDAEGGIYVVGVTTRTVTSEEETLQCLKGGALSRTTASTNMNTQSSRSHAIFTLHIKQQRVVKVSSEDQSDAQTNDNEGMQEFETLMAKFHFVDLAGSERLKRTGATGDRAKEGISINCGLLALGNVISALGDPTKRATHVPYRDSKLTRLLQDSLGGNSRTLMIACCSPSDKDFMETLNTLRYANRARNIKNVVTANQDKTSRQLAALRTEIRLLQEELLEYKQGKRSVGADGVEQVNDLFHENTMLQTESERMRQRIKAMQETIDAQSERIAILLTQQARLGLDKDIGSEKGDDDSNLTNMMQGYIAEIENLRAKLVESESINSSLRRQTAESSPTRVPSRATLSPTHIPLSARSASFGYEAGYGDDTRVASVLSEAKKQVEHDQEKLTEARTKLAVKDSDEDSSLSKDVEPTNNNEVGAEAEMKAAEKGEGKEVDGVRDLEEMGDAEEDEDDDDEDEEEEEEEDESSSSDSDEDAEDGEIKLQEELAEIACEINIKQRLIEELETSQRRLQTMKAQYEQKLESLQNRIKETENERDKVLANLGSMAETRTKEKAEKIKKEFEIKLKKLSEEKSRLQKASKEHTKLMRDKSQHERQMKTLTNDLAKMKETRVKLMKQIKEEQQKGRKRETESRREIQKIKKQSRQYESRVKTLEAEARQREIVLKRKHEELQALRKTKKPMSDKVAGRVIQRPNSARSQRADPLSSRSVAKRTLNRKGMQVPPPRKRERTNTSEYSSKAAKLKWHNVEKKVNHIVSRKQTVALMEKDMERFMHHRNRLGRQLEKSMIELENARREGATEDILEDLKSQIVGLQANIEYVQDQITECQNSIMEVMEGKDEIDSTDAAAIIDSCSLDEAKYLLEHFVTNAITTGFQKAQRESDVKELTAKLHQEEQTGFLQQQLLQHLISEQEGELELELDGLFTREEPETSSSAESSRASSPTENQINGKLDHTSNRIATSNSISLPATNGLSSHVPQPTTRSKVEKARRRTATKEDLLYAGGRTTDGGREPSALFSLTEVEEPTEPDSTVTLPTRSSSVKMEQVTNHQTRKPPRPNSVPGLRERPKFYIGRVRTTPWSPLPSDIDSTPSSTPPSSPPVKSKSENVFSRLTQTTSPLNVHKDRGSINPVSTKAQNAKAPLTCSFVAEGHSKAVLSVQATEEHLFSGSKDRTVKIWRLDTKQEVATLAGHPNNVSCVKYCEKLQLVFTVSTAYIRVWDIRNTTKSIKTLSSSGFLLDNNAGASSSRTLTLPQGENPISDIALNQTATKLYAASGNLVRIWDLNSFNCICKLSGGPSAAVMCVCVSSEVFKDVDLVLAGSKDHYVKLFEVPVHSGGCLMPRANLEPPHYDGVQSMVTDGRILFSGSRDRSIKKWNIIQKNQQQSITSAHKDWICALDFLPKRECLISGCRAGFLKFWKKEDCSMLAEMKAHTSPINSIATNSTHIFTASSDRTVSVWRPQGSLEHHVGSSELR